jgi:hypothetical protein
MIMLFLKKNAGIFGVAGLLLCVFFILARPFPYDYDSISYARAIGDKFDIRINQPHAFGALFHVMFGRLVHIFIYNTFTVQQVLNLIYITLTAFIISRAKQSGFLYLMLFASTPVSLFLSSVPLIYGASFATSSLIAYQICRTKNNRDVFILGVVFFTCAGFRQDTLLLMGPVVALAVFKVKPSIKTLIITAATGSIITAAWYVPTSLMSGNANVFLEAGKVTHCFLSCSSVFFGATVFQHMRSATRFLIYSVAALGPAGFYVLFRYFKKSKGADTVFMLAGILPVMLYGILFYFGYSYYYATIAGFLYTFTILKLDAPWNKKTAVLMIALNFVFFWFIPEPVDSSPDNFSARTLKSNIYKQISYTGGNGRRVILQNRAFPLFLDTTLAKCRYFSDRDWTGNSGVSYPRLWEYMSKNYWNNHFLAEFDSTRSFIGIVRPEENPSYRFMDIGVWVKD